MALLQRQTETQRRMLANPSRLLPPDLRYAAPIFSVTMVEFNEEDDGVVHAEVAEVGADPEDGLAEAGREAESVAVSHLVIRKGLIYSNFYLLFNVIIFRNVEWNVEALEKTITLQSEDLSSCVTIVRTFSMKKQAEELMHTWPLELLDVVRVNADDIIIRIK
ncbi:hypothetical protein ACLOJK_019687 [Asimina triloba]